MNSTDESQPLNFGSIISFLWKHKWPLIGVSLLSGILAYLFSGPSFIQRKYESVAIFYAATTNSVSKALLNPRPGPDDDALAFGEEEQAEQLLQLLNSEEVRGKIIKKYNLMGRYDIDTSSRYPYTKLYKEYKDNVKSRRTEFMSIEVKVRDHDPIVAANIANDIVKLVDSAKNKIQRKRALLALDIVQKSYTAQVHRLDSITKELTIIGSKGVFDYTEQTASLTQEHARAMSGNNSRAMKELNAQRDSLGKYGPKQKTLQNLLEFESENLAIVHTQLENIRTDANQSLPATLPIDEALPSEKQVYPSRPIIVLITIMLTFLASSAILAFLEMRNKGYKGSLTTS